MAAARLRLASKQAKWKEVAAMELICHLELVTVTGSVKQESLYKHLDGRRRNPLEL